MEVDQTMHVKKILSKKSLLILFSLLLIVSPFASFHNLAHAEKENNDEKDVNLELSNELAREAGDFELAERDDGTIKITGYSGETYPLTSTPQAEQNLTPDLSAFPQ